MGGSMKVLEGISEGVILAVSPTRPPTSKSAPKTFSAPPRPPGKVGITLDLDALSFKDVTPIMDVRNRTICITGAITGYTRAQLTQRLARLGTTVQSGVSGTTEFLVVGDKPGNDKLQGADRYGITKVSAADFMRAVAVALGEVPADPAVVKVAPREIPEHYGQW